VVVRARSGLERAADNVLDNAIKWSPAGGTVGVRLVDGVLTVRDTRRCRRPPTFASVVGIAAFAVLVAISMWSTPRPDRSRESRGSLRSDSLLRERW
jgi:hypothetical protein